MNNYKLISLLVLLFLLCNFAISAQPKQYTFVTRTLKNSKTLDMANMKISYSLEFVPDSTESHKKWKDKKILLIGETVHHFYSQYSRMQDSVVTNATKAYKPYSPPAEETAERYDIYSNFPENTRTVVENIMTFNMSIYKEELTDQIWGITGEITTILDYLCYKAVCTYRGRIWEAWFTMDIPINAGPWKFRGLPGLIMKVADERQHYVFECTGIEKLKKPEPILMYEAAYPSTVNPDFKYTRDMFLDALRDFHVNYLNSLLSMGYNVRIVDSSGKVIESIETPNTTWKDQNMSYWTTINARDRNRKVPYNPIELE